MKNILLSGLCSIALLASAQNDKPYFQQEVNYTIRVKLDDNKHELDGDVAVEYVNNSPDELPFIWFHIWPNAYKNNSTALAEQLIEDGNKKFYFADDEERGWISNLDFKADGQSVKTEAHPEHIDIIKVVLNAPLKPGSRITISTPFQVHIPIGEFSRLGHIEQQYQITQWYPKPAVYDNRGWHPIPYLNQGEFYSEFGSFDVSITLPKNYVVGATGTLVDGADEQAWMKKRDVETRMIKDFSKISNSFPPSSSEMKTLRYKASNVHDFAWFADKRYYVLYETVTLPHSKEKVDCWSMFTPAEGNLWMKSAEYVKDAVYYYSLWNGDYPYPHATAIDGALSAGGGMEYPMITVIGEMNDAKGLDRVIAHEVGHNWFYGILGSNEREHAWMDEGVNSFNENRYMKTKYAKDSLATDEGSAFGLPAGVAKLFGVSDLDESTLMELGYRFNAVRKKDQPCDLHSGKYTATNYGIIVYGKTALILAFLQEYLGTELYDQCAKKYFETWKFRHPYPADMKKVFEEVSGKDLGWFFNTMIPTTGIVDYKILSCKKSSCAKSFTGECWEVNVKNKGSVPAPFSITAFKNDKEVGRVWFDGFTGRSTVQLFIMDFDRLEIDAEEKSPEVNRQNNQLKMRGLSKKCEPLQVKGMGLIHNTDKTQLFWAPVVGWNKYNKFMAGAAFYNNVLPEKKLEYVFMPMYAFGNKDLAGGASVNYNMHFDNIFQTVRLGIDASRYSFDNSELPNVNFNKLAPQVEIEFRKKHPRRALKHSIRLRQVCMWKEFAVRDMNLVTPTYSYDTTNININDFTYLISNKRKIDPYTVSLNFQGGEGMMKTSLTATYEMTLKKKKQGIALRFFAGKMLETSNDGNYFLHSSGSNGQHDYFMDGVFLGRSEREGFFSHQFMETEGNLKAYTILGRSDDWMVALNFNAPMPGKIPFRLFADFVMVPSAPGLDQNLLWDAGLHFTLVRNIVDVYVPILVSKDIKSNFYLNNSDLDTPTSDKTDPEKWTRIWRMVRFTFNLQRANPFKLIRELDI